MSQRFKSSLSLAAKAFAKATQQNIAGRRYYDQLTEQTKRQREADAWTKEQQIQQRKAWEVENLKYDINKKLLEASKLDMLTDKEKRQLTFIEKMIEKGAMSYDDVKNLNVWKKVYGEEPLDITASPKEYIDMSKNALTQYRLNFPKRDIPDLTNPDEISDFYNILATMYGSDKAKEYFEYMGYIGKETNAPKATFKKATEYLNNLQNFKGIKKPTEDVFKGLDIYTPTNITDKIVDGQLISEKKPVKSTGEWNFSNLSDRDVRSSSYEDLYNSVKKPNDKTWEELDSKAGLFVQERFKNAVDKYIKGIELDEKESERIRQRRRQDEADARAARSEARAARAEADRIRKESEKEGEKGDKQRIADRKEAMKFLTKNQDENRKLYKNIAAAGTAWGMEKLDADVYWGKLSNSQRTLVNEYGALQMLGDGGRNSLLDMYNNMSIKDPKILSGEGIKLKNAFVNRYKGYYRLKGVTEDYLNQIVQHTISMMIRNNKFPKVKTITKVKKQEIKSKANADYNLNLNQ